MNKMSEIYMIFARKIVFHEFWGQFPALKLRVSEIDPNANYVIMVDIVLRAQSLLNKLFMRLRTLLYSISLHQGSANFLGSRAR